MGGCCASAATTRRRWVESTFYCCQGCICVGGGSAAHRGALPQNEPKHHNTSHTHNRTPKHIKTYQQRDLLEALYRCASALGKPELHARFIGDPNVQAAFDELLEGARGGGGAGGLDLAAGLARVLAAYNDAYGEKTG